MKNKEIYKDLLWFNVEVTYSLKNEANVERPLVEGDRFYIWREPLDASTCELSEFVGNDEYMFPNETKEIILVVITSSLSKSFNVNEKLFWGIPQKSMGYLLIKEIITEKTEDCIVLFRPINKKELDLIEKLNFEKFPPRLAEQPIFYPVLNEEYASKIAREWNLPAYGAGYVTRFKIKKYYISKFDIKNVGGEGIEEYWIPAEELENFNKNIIGKIEIVKEFKL